MTQSIREIMTPHPTVQPATNTLVDAARAMRDADMGDVLVERDGELCGIVTDRDIVVRAVADGMDPSEVRLGDVCSGQLTSVTPDAAVEDAIEKMRDHALRRIPVLEDGHAVGIVSIGDLALERDGRSVLAGISAAAPNN